MGVLLTSNQPGTQSDYIRAEVGLVDQWATFAEAKHQGTLKKNDVCYAWIRLFAAEIETLCHHYGVPLDTLQSVMREFQEQILRDLALQKWARSYTAHHDVGWGAAARSVDSSIRDVRDRLDPFIVIGLRLTLRFPFVPTAGHPAGEDAVRTAFFPLPGASGQVEETEGQERRAA